MFKHRKIIKKGAAAVTTMPGIYLTNYETVGLEIFRVTQMYISIYRPNI